MKTNNTYNIISKSLSKVLCILAILPLCSLTAMAQDDPSLYIAGELVTSANANDVLNDGGSVRYDAATKTLTLTNVNIITEGDYSGIESMHAVSTLRLVGSNKLGEILLRMNYGETATICGRGFDDRLEITNVKNGITIQAWPHDYEATLPSPGLTIHDCSINVNAAWTGIEGWGVLKVEDASVSAVGREDGSIVGWNDLILGNKMKITLPAGAYFEENIHAITLDGKEPCRSQVTIKSEMADVLPDNSLLLYQLDGTVVAYAFDDEPVISYSGDYLVMTTASTSVEYHLATLRKIAFADEWKAALGINEITVPDTEFSFSDEDAKVRGEKPGTPFYVFDMKGMKCAEGTIDAEGKANIRLSSLPSGIYIIKTQSTSFKIKK